MQQDVEPLFTDPPAKGEAVPQELPLLDSAPAPGPSTAHSPPDSPPASALDAPSPAAAASTIAEESTDDAAWDDAGETEDSSADLAEWKDALRRDFEDWLETLEAIPEPASIDADSTTDADIAADAPDLYSFHEQLAGANAEARKANRRTAEAFSQWGDTLSRFDADLRLLREHLARQPAASDDALPRPWALALVEFVDRLQRLAAAFAAPPSGKSWFGGDARWSRAWATQRQGFDILLSHVETLLQQAGLARIAVAGQPFDPATMSAVATAPASNCAPGTVLEEVAPGYRLRGELLRVAQVKVSSRQ